MAPTADHAVAEGEHVDRAHGAAAVNPIKNAAECT
jgi:hypothetical protein